MPYTVAGKGHVVLGNKSCIFMVVRFVLCPVVGKGRVMLNSSYDSYGIYNDSHMQIMNTLVIT